MHVKITQNIQADRIGGFQNPPLSARSFDSGGFENRPDRKDRPCPQNGSHGLMSKHLLAATSFLRNSPCHLYIKPWTPIGQGFWS